MPGVKQFTNRTEGILSMTLYIRSGENPANYAGTTTFTLKPGETRTVEYGNAQDIYVNGYQATAAFAGQLLTVQEVVTNRGCQLDDRFNTNSKFEIGYQAGALIIQGHN